MFLKKKNPTNTQEAQLTGPDLEEYFEARYEYLANAGEIELEITRNLQNLVDKSLTKFEQKAQLITSESNSFERQHTGFFAISISFIIAGLLNVLPQPEDSIATHFLFTVSILSAIVAAGVLFLEYINNSKFHSDWQYGNDKVIQYITRGNWKNPVELNDKITELQQDIPQRSRSWAFNLELVLITLSLLSLGLWVVENVYNPNYLPWI